MSNNLIEIDGDLSKLFTKKRPSESREIIRGLLFSEKPLIFEV